LRREKGRAHSSLSPLFVSYITEGREQLQYGSRSDRAGTHTQKKEGRERENLNHPHLDPLSLSPAKEREGKKGTYDITSTLVPVSPARPRGYVSSLIRLGVHSIAHALFVPFNSGFWYIYIHIDVHGMCVCVNVFFSTDRVWWGWI